MKNGVVSVLITKIGDRGWCVCSEEVEKYLITDKYFKWGRNKNGDKS